MKLPNGKRAYIPKEKLTDYILSETHAGGKSKAKFFRSVGFNETNTSVLEKSRRYPRLKPWHFKHITKPA